MPFALIRFNAFVFEAIEGLALPCPRDCPNRLFRRVCHGYNMDCLKVHQLITSHPYLHPVCTGVSVVREGGGGLMKQKPHIVPPSLSTESIDRPIDPLIEGPSHGLHTKPIDR